MTKVELCGLCEKEQLCSQQKIHPNSPYCKHIPKYNVCPCCLERVLRTEPRCTKCGYDFKDEEIEE